MTLTTTNLKPEQVQELLRNSTPGSWSAFHKSKYDEWHVSVPLEDGSGMTLGLFADGIETNHREADARLIALAPELAQGWVALYAAALALVELDEEHRAWLEATPPGLRGEKHETFLSRFDGAYSALATLVQPSAASAGAGASGGAGEVVRDDTPERLPDLIGQFGDRYADVDLEEGETELPVMLTLYHAALLEAHAGGDEADAALPLGFEDAEALGVRLIEQARRGRAGVSAH